MLLFPVSLLRKIIEEIFQMKTMFIREDETLQILLLKQLILHRTLCQS